MKTPVEKSMNKSDLLTNLRIETWRK